MSLISIPVGIKAGEFANYYAIPLICAINLSCLMKIVLEMLVVSNDYKLKEILNLIAMCTGFYFG